MFHLKTALQDVIDENSIQSFNLFILTTALCQINHICTWFHKTTVT